MKFNKKCVNIIVVVFVCTFFILGYMAVDFFKVEYYSNINNIVDDNLGLLKYKVNKEEKDEVEKLISIGNYLSQKRIEKNKIQPGFLESSIYSLVDNKLNEYTIKYLLNGYEYENYESDNSDGIQKDKTLNKLKGILSESDYKTLKQLIEDYNQGDYESIDKMQDILSIYNKKNADVIVMYLTENSSLDLKASFDITKNLNLKYRYIKGLTQKYLNDKENEEYENIWEKIKFILPNKGLENFDELYLTTDGKLNELASVKVNNDSGSRWIMNIDPEDVVFKNKNKLFYETILHEYFHYMTLNDKQVKYTENYNMKNYCEEGLVSNKNSYINDFYNEFWKDILEDRNINKENLYFYDRHKNSFVDEYASTDPSEDIAETFSYFVLNNKPRGHSIKDQKINFFYKYKDLVELRNQLRSKINTI
ncbi:hypothetical protein QJS64_11795 [Paraclostridium bifermentans]|uniref:Uncharacterized protein n=1 Tax=Paraclostridium bifermentans TaxID=1490 RepID=A0ABY8QZU0_PARBF|nr:hypothetical protein QJS64_11795 [Paraclostridium bifermentans]